MALNLELTLDETALDTLHDVQLPVVDLPLASNQTDNTALLLDVDHQDATAADNTTNGNAANLLFLSENHSRLDDREVTTWTINVRCTVDVVVGVTEAASLQARGRCIAFDTRANFEVGWAPSKLCLKFSSSDLKKVQGASVFFYEAADGSVETVGSTEDGVKRFRIAATRQRVSIRFFDNSLKYTAFYPLDNWSSARLLVRFKSTADSILSLSE